MRPYSGLILGYLVSLGFPARVLCNGEVTFVSTLAILFSSVEFPFSLSLPTHGHSPLLGAD